MLAKRHSESALLFIFWSVVQPSQMGRAGVTRGIDWGPVNGCIWLAKRPREFGKNRSVYPTYGRLSRPFKRPHHCCGPTLWEGSTPTSRPARVQQLRLHSKRPDGLRLVTRSNNRISFAHALIHRAHPSNLRSIQADIALASPCARTALAGPTMDTS